MIFRKAAFRLAVLHQVLGALAGEPAAERRVIASASAGNAIHLEREVDLQGSAGAPVRIASDVPVTVQRHGRSGEFPTGLRPGTARLLVTSDCDTDETQAVPEVTVTPAGINVAVDPEADAATRFLEPSSLSALWSRVSGLCRRGLRAAGGQGGRSLQGSSCDVEVSSGKSESCGSGSGKGGSGGSQLFCQLGAGVCGSTSAATVKGTCETKPEVCTMQVDPVCGCDGETYSNNCKANSAGVSVDYQGECQRRPASPGVITGAAGCKVGDDTCGDGKFCELEVGVCDDSSDGACQTRPEFCYEMYEPVCGCDGATYDNDCYARLAGVSVSGKGECDAQTTAGTEMELGTEMCEVDPDSCGKGRFCQVVAGACGNEQGVCQTRPEACTFLFAPVCGCDGVNYSNDCQAFQAGTSVAHEGGCDAKPADPSVGTGTVAEICEADADSCGKGRFCQLGAGACGNEQGVCQTRPEACTFLYAPVCGCDGVSYSNDCQAFQAGTSVDYEGECDAKPADPSVGTTLDLCMVGDGSCGDDQFCELKIGVCDGSIGGGLCQTKPETCYEIYEPVCGCDGRTYDNVCYAQLQGMSVSGKGECDADDSVGTESVTDVPTCEVGPSTDTSKICGKGEFCRLDTGACGTSSDSQQGVCQTRPEACTFLYAPVCGCDGKDYSNDCQAFQAGTSVAYEGECVAKPSDPSVGTGTVGCEVGDDICGDGQFCKSDPGVCGDGDSSPGVCQPKPGACTYDYTPVCGCDGASYSNDCLAFQAGTSVASKGDCDAKPADPSVGTATVRCVGDEACGEGQFCELATGVCDASSPGVCQTKPEFCYKKFEPVCGCDGTTYNNDCYAQEAGVSVSEEGECKTCPSGYTGLRPHGDCSRYYRCEAGRVVTETLQDCPAGTLFDFENQFCNWPDEMTCETQDKPVGTEPVGTEIATESVGTTTPATTSAAASADTTAPATVTAATTPIAAAGCRVGDDACGNGQFCDPGGCDDSADGVCQTKPEFCYEVYEPVCGCDGTTYDNDCYARLAGVSVSSKTPCATQTTADAGTGPTAEVCEVDPSADPSADVSDSCGKGEFCQLDYGVCGTSSPSFTGVCQTRPEACTFLYAPVCGCDGKDYSNDCSANQAGASVAYKGECTTKPTDPSVGTGTVGCAGDEACGEGQFCELAPGVCDDSGDGVCQTKPDFCSRIYEPVCGCDGTTYDNACGAQLAGVSIFSKGECAVKPVAETEIAEVNKDEAKTTVENETTEDVDEATVECEVGPAVAASCGEGRFCQLDAGVCDTSSPSFTGVCQAMPEVCPAILAPVCGCDGETHSNDCAARAAGTSVAYEGECEAVKTTAATVGSASGVSSSEATTEDTTDVSATVSTEVATDESASDTAPTTVAPDLTISGNFPTESPTTKPIEDSPPTTSPTIVQLETEPDDAISSGHAFRQRSFFFRVAIALMSIAVVSVLFPGSRGGRLGGLGKFAVVAMAASSLLPRDGRVRGRAGSRSRPAIGNERAHPTCSFNVEILVDGCDHPLDIVAPSARVIDAIGEDVAQQQRPEDPCVADYEAALVFPATGSAIELDLPADGSVPPFPANSDRCLRLVEG